VAASKDDQNTFYLHEEYTGAPTTAKRGMLHMNQDIKPPRTYTAYCSKHSRSACASPEDGIHSTVCKWKLGSPMGKHGYRTRKLNKVLICDGLVFRFGVLHRAVVLLSRSSHRAMLPQKANACAARIESGTLETIFPRFLDTGRANSASSSVCDARRHLPGGKGLCCRIEIFCLRRLPRRT